MKLIKSLPLGLILFAGNFLIGMEPASQESAVLPKQKDKEKKPDSQTQLFVDSFNATTKNISTSNISAFYQSIKTLEMMVQQRHQEAMAQSKIIENLQKIENPCEPSSHNTRYPHKNKSKIKLLRQQFDKYQETIGALTTASAQLVAYHKASLEFQRKAHKVTIARSKESEQNQQEFEKQCEERRLKEEQKFKLLGEQ